MPLNSKSVYCRPNPDFLPFASRRSVVHSTNGIVTCTQASGRRYRTEDSARGRKCCAAALNVTEPSSTSIGDDMFCLLHNVETKTIRAMNGSGRYPGNATVEQIKMDLNVGPD
ncbi:hypothetical protein N7534_007212 [Penicillium rubens]|nr:hypothetical protein N7534_007212 [Penicillium rubens]